MSELSDQFKEHRLKVQAERMEYALKKFEKLGIPHERISDSTIQIEHNGNIINFFPHTGWHSGKGIKDGRGLNKLLNQLTWRINS